ncbi:MAG: hypothetical protein Barrevirus6_31, partial [Barrevirus sp.]
KKRFFKAPIFGYFDVPHKESFRLLTGPRILEHNMPPNFTELKSLIHSIDQIMYTVALSLFPNVLTDKELDLPFFDLQDKQFGMFDITKYYNDGSRKRLNCEEHYDPGLLSLSLRSSEPGLELKDEFGKWIKAPTDKTIGILWAGKAGCLADPKVKPGIHRVVNPVNLGKPRIAMWHEICTRAQEHRELLNTDIKKKKEKSVLSKYLSSYNGEAKTGIPTSKTLSPTALKPRTEPFILSPLTGLPITTRVNKSIRMNPVSFESESGIPMSKSGYVPPDVQKYYKDKYDRETRGRVNHSKSF